MNLPICHIAQDFNMNKWIGSIVVPGVSFGPFFLTGMCGEAFKYIGAFMMMCALGLMWQIIVSQRKEIMTFTQLESDRAN